MVCRFDRQVFLVYLFLVLTTFSLYWRVSGYDFINFDDYDYVAQNPYVQAGLTAKGTIWALTSFHGGNWHPLTWLSHMLDCQLFGSKAGMHHLTNLLIHIVNSILLFLVFGKMTGSVWRSAFVAAMFALHPLHVESVAWISERKDVLSTFFWMLTMWAYIRYTERSGLARYLLIPLFFFLGLMSKPMLVTLPFVLLLMDFWPLGRLKLGQSGKENGIEFQKTSVSWLIMEKAPLFAITAVVSIVTIIAAQKGGAVPSLDSLSLMDRAANSLVSYIGYIRKMFWPNDLAVFYPHPGSLPMWQAAGAGLLLTCLSVIFIKGFRRRPYLAVGWLWYLGSLVPVIGLVQGGAQAIADRYTYIPLIGLFIMLAWGISDLAGKWRYRRLLLGIMAGLLLFAIVVCTHLQLRHWENSIFLFSHTANVTANNYLAHNNLGNAFFKHGMIAAAIKHYSESLRIKPSYAKAYYNLANALQRQGNIEQAINHYLAAVRISPLYAEAHNNLGAALADQGKIDEAISHFEEAVRIKPDFIVARQNLNRFLKLRHKREGEFSK